MCTIVGNLMAALSTTWQGKMVTNHAKLKILNRSLYFSVMSNINKKNIIKNIFCCLIVLVLVVIGGTGEHNDTEISVEYLDLDTPTQWTFLNPVHTPRCCWPQVKQIHYLPNQSLMNIKSF